MRTHLALPLLALAIGLGASRSAEAQEAKPAPTRLVVLWTSGDPEVAHNVCLMYAHAAGKNKWFDEVRLVVWGPSARLLAADKKLQAKVKAMKADGIILEACVVCASSYGVSESLRALGIDVKGMGKPLTDYIQQGWKILTF